MAGRLLLHLSLGARPLGPPIDLLVLPAEACARHSLALPAGLGLGLGLKPGRGRRRHGGGDDAAWASEWQSTAGQPATLGVRLRDAFGNACDAEGSCEAVALQLRGAEIVEGSVHLAPPHRGPPPAPPAPPAPPVPPAEDDGAAAAVAAAAAAAFAEGEGEAAGGGGGRVLRATATPRLCGRYYAHVTLRGVELMGSPRLLLVRAAAAVASCCDVSCEGLGGGVVTAGSPCGFHVQAAPRPRAMPAAPRAMPCARRLLAAPMHPACSPTHSVLSSATVRRHLPWRYLPWRYLPWRCLLTMALLTMALLAMALLAMALLAMALLTMALLTRYSSSATRQLT